MYAWDGGGRMNPEAGSEGRRWTPVAEEVFAPAVAACGDRSISLFMRGARGNLLLRRRDAELWGEQRSLGVPLGRAAGKQVPLAVDWPIAACSTGDGEIHLVARVPKAS